MGGHRELCLAGMCGGLWDSLVEVQRLVKNNNIDLSLRCNYSLFSSLLIFLSDSLITCLICKMRENSEQCSSQFPGEIKQKILKFQKLELFCIFV